MQNRNCTAVENGKRSEGSVSDADVLAGRGGRELSTISGSEGSAEVDSMSAKQ
jgi:hypothetical protein